MVTNKENIKDFIEPHIYSLLTEKEYEVFDIASNNVCGAMLVYWIKVISKINNIIYIHISCKVIFRINFNSVHTISPNA